MNIYKVTYRNGWNDNRTSKYVAAANAAKAIDNMNRYTKKNYVSNYEIVEVEKVLAVDIHYK